jgi:methionyl-tRNA synthetase
VFYLTTAIDYTNGAPHIGHAYEKVLADVIARYQRLRGEEVYFLTGVDQHGQKVQQTAEKDGVNPATYVKRVTKGFLNAWDKLGLEYDGWAETTNSEHQSCVQGILQKLYDEGQIYKKRYTGHYSIRQEQFLTDKERNEDGEFGEEWGEVEERDEENYYFKLSDHVSWLKNLVESQEDFVTFVWFDALINYISFAGYNKAVDSSLPDFEKLWPASIHIIGKDILVPSHSIYWMCMLHAIGFNDQQIPSLLCHGWWNIKKKSAQGNAGSEKMSKSLGNVVDPVELVDTFGQDAVRYYLVRDIHTGRDSDYDMDRLVMLFNTELANNLGNLCNRALNMTKRYCGGVTMASEYDDEPSQQLRASLDTVLEKYRHHMDCYEISFALEAIIEFISGTNVYAEQQKPWEIAKDESKAAQLRAVLNHMVEAVAQASVLLKPIIPTACERIQSQLNAPHLAELSLSELHWGLLPVGQELAKPKPVFPRIQLED